MIDRGGSGGVGCGNQIRGGGCPEGGGGRGPTGVPLRSRLAAGGGGEQEAELLEPRPSRSG
jgi:hypothetical protein